MIRYREYTPTQQKIMELLSDYLPHSSEEILRQCFEDELSTIGTLHTTIYNLRKVLAKKGYGIVRETFVGDKRGACYRLSRTISIQ